MKARAFTKTHGRHGYRGKRAGRGARLMAKFCVPLSQTENVQKIFKQIEKERSGK